VKLLLTIPMAFNADPFAAACCGRGRSDGGAVLLQGNEQRPPKPGLLSSQPLAGDIVSREEIEEWCQTKFYELTKGFESNLTGKYVSSFSSFEGRLGMLEHAQRLSAHERKSQSPVAMMSNSDQQVELLAARLTSMESHVKEMQAPIAMLQERGDMGADRGNPKASAVQDEQIISSILMRIEMCESTMATVDAGSRSCALQVSALQAAFDQLDKTRLDPSLPSFGGTDSPKFGSSPAPSVSLQRESTDQRMLGRELTSEMTRGSLGTNGTEVRGQIRDLRATITDLQAELRASRQSKASTVDVDDAGVELQMVEEAKEQGDRDVERRKSSEKSAAAKKGSKWALCGRKPPESPR
jgi:hypothetical protein